jgi:hypothetical protein
LLILQGAFVFLCLCARLARARYKLVGVTGGIWGLFSFYFWDDAVSRPNRGAHDFERTHPLMLMCGKSGLNFLFMKFIVTLTQVIFYKSTHAGGALVGLLGLWLVVWSHRWPPYHFAILNRVRLALDYAIAWIYWVSCVTVLFYTGSIAWILNVLLPRWPNSRLSSRSPTFNPSEDDEKQWATWLQLAPIGIAAAALIGYFADYLDRGCGRCCIAFCRCITSERYWVEKEDRKGCCGRVDHDYDEEKAEEKESSKVSGLYAGCGLGLWADHDTVARFRCPAQVLKIGDKKDEDRHVIDELSALEGAPASLATDLFSTCPQAGVCVVLRTFGWVLQAQRQSYKALTTLSVSFE